MSGRFARARPARRGRPGDRRPRARPTPVDRRAQRLGFGADRLGSAAARVGERPRGTQQKARAARIESGRERGIEIAALRADARNQEADLRVRQAQFAHLGGIGRADDEHEVAMLVPVRGRVVGDAPVQRPAVDHDVLKVACARIRGPTQDEGAAIGTGEERPHRVLAHIGIDRDRIRAVALERLARVRLGGIADVAALRVEDDERGGCALADVADGCLELALFAERAVERDLRLVGGRNIERRVDDAAAERQEGLGIGAQIDGNSRRVRIQTHANQAIGGPLRSIDSFGKHERRYR